MVAVIALAGCSAGQVAETAMLKAPVSGLNTESPDGGMLIRNLQVVYNSPDGYQTGSIAPLEVSLFNQTEQPMTVLISSKPQKADGIVSAEQIGVGSTAPASAAPTTEPTPDPSASASTEPTAPAVQPAKFTIAPLGSETFLAGDSPTLQAVGLSGVLIPGLSLSLTFEVQESNQAFDVLVPFGVPTSPVSRAPGVEGESTEE
jgi:hypothetical protein